MEQNNKWSLAALNGLLLSFITVIYFLIGAVLELKGVVSIFLWVLKTTGSLYLLYYFMKQYSTQFKNISYGDSFNYGVLLCVFSTIICACYSFVSVTFLFPNQIEIIVEQIHQTLSTQNYTSDEEASIDKWLDRIPELMLFGTLVYYTLWGIIASAIIANFTRKIDIFAAEN